MIIILHLRIILQDRSIATIILSRGKGITLILPLSLTSKLDFPQNLLPPDILSISIILNSERVPLHMPVEIFNLQIFKIGLNLNLKHNSLQQRMSLHIYRERYRINLERKQEMLRRHRNVLLSSIVNYTRWRVTSSDRSMKWEDKATDLKI